MRESKKREIEERMILAQVTEAEERARAAEALARTAELEERTAQARLDTALIELRKARELS